MNIWGSLGLALALVILTTGASGCGQAFNSASGDDAKRAGALGFGLNSPSDDRVSASQGDHTDWKSFEIEDDANVRLRIWWDEPGIEAHVTLVDERAKGIAEIIHEAGARYDELAPVGLAAGLYFIQVEADGGASVYTIEVLTEQPQGGGASGNRPGF
jgi:hypothetical protein